MLTLVVILKALAEIAGLALLGQGVLYVLAGAGREQNVFYRVLKVVTSPVVKLTRLITPKFIGDRQVAVLAFAVVGGLYVALILLQWSSCLENLGHPGCQRLASSYQARCESGEAQACEVLRRSGLPAVSGRGR